MPPEAPELFKQIFEEAKESLNKAIQKNSFSNIKGIQVMDFSEIITPLEEFPVLKIPKKEEPIAKFQALWRGYAVRKRMNNVNRIYQTHYNFAIWDLMKREINFLWTMNKNIRDVESRLLKPNKFSTIQFSNAKLAKSQVHNIISNIKAIVEVHDIILEELSDLYTEQWPVVRDVGKFLLAKSKLFIVYRTYVEMHCYFQRVIATCDDFSDLNLILDSKSSAYGSRSLTDVIVLAFKHISAWKIPLQNLVDISLIHKINLDDTYNIMQTYAIMTRIGRFFHLLHDWKQRELVKYIEQKIDDLPMDLSNNIHRRFLLDGSVTFSSQSRYIFLFNDLFVVCRLQKKKNQIQYKFKCFENLIGCSVSPKKTGFTITDSNSDKSDYNTIIPKSNESKQWIENFEIACNRWKSAIFCIPLKYLLLKDNLSEDSDVPFIVLNIIQCLFDSKINESILYASNDTYSVSVLRNSLEETNDIKSINWKHYANETVVGVLKLFCDELPEPLLEWNFCSQFTLFTSEKDPDEEGFSEMISSLSPPNRNCLKTIISFLHNSKVDPVLLALNWTQHLLRFSCETLDTATDIQWGINVITELIKNCSQHFRMDPQSPGSKHKTRKSDTEFMRGRFLLKLK